jgi:hypothetical protein
MNNYILTQVGNANEMPVYFAVLPNFTINLLKRSSNCMSHQV